MESNPAIVHAFLARLLRDQAEGTLLDVESYQRLFPGFEDVVAEQYRAAQEDVDEPEEHRVGRFILGRSLGAGGQGAVYEAEDPTLGRRVAIKLLTGLGDQSTDVLRRFRREAEVSSRLEHPNICTVHEASLDGQIPYIVMRLVDGETLGAKIARARRKADGPPDPVLPVPVDRPEDVRAVLRYFASVADALDAAHRVGVTHRDVKPGNLMVQPDGSPMILDFGLASAVEASAPAITMTGDVFGTPAYMAPEQIEVGEVRPGPTTDVHALAVCLFQTLTLTLPFAGHSRESLFREILTREPIDPLRLRPDLPRDLGVVLAKAMQKDPRHRYPSATAFAEDLRAVAELRPISARPTPPLVRLARWCRREPGKARLIGLATLFAILALGSAGYLAARWRDFQDARTERELRAQLERVEDALERGFFEMEVFHYDAALSEFDAAMRLSGGTSVEATIGRVMAALRSDRDAEGLAALDRDGRDHPALRRARAAVLDTIGDDDEAERIRAELGDPSDELDLLVEALWKMTDRTARRVESAREAVALMNRVNFVAERPRALYHMERIRAASVAVDREAQKESAEAMMAHWPDNPIALAHLAFVLVDDDPDAALEAARKCLDVHPDHVPSWHVTAMALTEKGRPEEALDAAERALTIRPDYGGAELSRAHALVMLEDFEAAERSVDRARRLLPRDEHLHYLRGVILSKTGRHEEALEELELATLASKPKLLVSVGECLFGLRRLEDAKRAFEDAARIDPELASAQNALAIARASTGDLEGAIDAFERLVALRPDDLAVHRNYGTALISAGRWLEMRAELRRWLATHPESIAHQVELARSFVAPGVPEEHRDPQEARRNALLAMEMWERSESGDEDLRAAIEALLGDS